MYIEKIINVILTIKKCVLEKHNITIIMWLMLKKAFYYE